MQHCKWEMDTKLYAVFPISFKKTVYSYIYIPHNIDIIQQKDQDKNHQNLYFFILSPIFFILTIISKFSAVNIYYFYNQKNQLFSVRPQHSTIKLLCGKLKHEVCTSSHFLSAFLHFRIILDYQIKVLAAFWGKLLCNQLPKD